MPKLPLPPADVAAARIRADEYRDLTPEALWWRIHRVAGRHVTPWNRLRHYGPIDSRFEPHPLPPGDYPERAAWYAAALPRTAATRECQARSSAPRGLAIAWFWQSARRRYGTYMARIGLNESIQFSDQHE